jgi:hypothetical protein
MGYDYVPGNLAAALALREAGTAATRVEVGYFITGPFSPSALSGGTRASVTGVLFERGFARRGGVVVGERAGMRYRTFDVVGARRASLSLGGSEHFTLPQTYPYLQDVDTYLGWFGTASKTLSMLSRTAGPMLAKPPIKRLTKGLLNRTFHGSTGGPPPEVRAKLGTVVVAEAFDRRGRAVGRAVVQGLNPYDFTAEMLAWSADRIINVGVRGVGALGPVSAFGLDELAEGVRQAGIVRTE